MGLLDDAIREHLDLKRRRGVDPAEIERAEQEALGPVRREPLGADEAAEMPAAERSEAVFPAPAGPSELGARADSQGPGEAYESDADDLDTLGDPEDWDGDDYLIENEPGDLTTASGAQRSPADGLDREADWEEDPGAASGDTVAYDVDSASEEDSDEDVLEETPEFLQDTPEHDRLWFEQRPPRDFDFDE